MPSVEIKCLTCGRALTNPESISRGRGPVCWARLQRNQLQKMRPLSEIFADEPVNNIHNIQKWFFDEGIPYLSVGTDLITFHELDRPSEEVIEKVKSLGYEVEFAK